MNSHGFAMSETSTPTKARNGGTTVNRARRWGYRMMCWARRLGGLLGARIAHLRREPEAGYTTETVLVTALLAAGALIVVGILMAKIIAKARGLTF